MVLIYGDARKMETNVNETTWKPRFVELDQNFLKWIKKFNYQLNVIYDIGASNGSWSVQMNEILPESQFILFEPLANSDEYSEILADRLSKHSNFMLEKVALGNQNGEITVNIMPNIVASTTLKYWTDKQKTVKLYTLNNLIVESKLPTPNMIKIDTQGSELAILQGATNILPEVDFLLLECWLIKGYGKNTPLLSDIIDFLLEFNFSLFELTGCYRNEEGVLAHQDCVFINTKRSLLPARYYAS